MSDMIFATSDIDRTLFQALLDAKDVHGGRVGVVEDVEARSADLQAARHRQHGAWPACSRA